MMTGSAGLTYAVKRARAESEFYSICFDPLKIRREADIQPVQLCRNEVLIFCGVVPSRIPCPRCLRTGLVRFERVLKAGQEERHFYCGACDYTWVVAGSDQAAGASKETTGKPPKRSR
jgi:hypothetical protein